MQPSGRVTPPCCLIWCPEPEVRQKIVHAEPRRTRRIILFWSTRILRATAIENAGWKPALRLRSAFSAAARAHRSQHCELQNRDASCRSFRADAGIQPRKKAWRIAMLPSLRHAATLIRRHPRIAGHEPPAFEPAPQPGRQLRARAVFVSRDIVRAQRVAPAAVLSAEQKAVGSAIPPC